MTGREAKNIIDEDLKILEILKKHIIKFGDGTNGYVGFEINDIENEEDYNELCAWLDKVKE